jgi:hypothetical protein
MSRSERLICSCIVRKFGIIVCNNNNNNNNNNNKNNIHVLLDHEYPIVKIRVSQHVCMGKDCHVELFANAFIEFEVSSWISY